MRRLLSWVVMLIGLYVYGYLMEVICNLIVLGIHAVSQHGIFAVILVIYICAGSIAFSLFILVIVLGAKGIVRLSQRCQKSKRGTRYIVAGIFYVVWYTFVIVGLVIGFVYNTLPLASYLTCVVMIIFSIVFIFTGHNATKLDGPPPTERERLEAKLAKVQAKENSTAIKQTIKELEQKGIDVNAILATAETEHQ